MDLDNSKTVPRLPLELAEPKRNANTIRQNIFLLILHKILLFVFIFGCVVGVYVFVLGGYENLCKTEIIVVTQPVNKSILINDCGSKPKKNTKLRRKRQILRIDNPKTVFEKFEKLQTKKKEKAKKIVSDFDALCHEESHRDVCNELIKNLKVLTDTKNINIKEQYNKGDITKREIVADSELLEPVAELTPSGLDSEVLIEPNRNCLLTRLLRQSGPYYYGYDNYKPEYHPELLTYPRQIPMSFLPPYGRTHEDIQKPHPQDIAIALNIMSKRVPSEVFSSSYSQGQLRNKHKFKQHPQDIETAMNIKTNCRPISKDSSVLHNCPSGTTACDNGDCINESMWCDGNVDCRDVSDESRCSCRERVDKTRLCDGYFDCPFGEDEMGCFGCSDNTFSCDVSDGTQSICYTKEQRCNNINDCPNHQDEIDCTMLAPSLHKKPLFGVSNTEGYLHRNFKGNWYAVCKNPYMWAHDACRRETGLIIRPPYIQEYQIDPLLKVNYINTAPGGLIHNSTTCNNSTAVYVTCPDLLCGTRILTSSQLIRENAENQLFGRNKRFLLHKNPFRFFFYDPLTRAKRDVASEDNRESRTKRTESRVVGGKPSQPAAWPWVVALYRNGLFHCGGVIINQNWVMSAAHCVNKYWQHYYEIQVGMLRRFSYSPQEQNYRVTHVIVNQNYDQHDMKNDLSLLKVKPAIQFSRWVRPICLPGPEVAGADWLWGPPIGTLCTAVGWGSTIEHGPDPDHLREVELPIWEHCNHREDQDGNEICAGLVEGGRDTCQGDSGGPLLCQNPANENQWYVAGIVSHGDGCARKGEPGVYTRVSLLVPWIKYHISSRNLPVIQPKQECPGFRCNSGIAKCLPKNRMFDKIIDCLDGEDEFNCEEEHTPSILEEILSIPFSKNANESASITKDFIKKGPVKINETEPDQHLASTNHAIVATVVTSENTVLKNITNSLLTNSTDINNITSDTLSNDTKPDTIKNHTEQLLHDSNAQNSSDESSEEVTDDPLDFSTTTEETIYMHDLVTRPFRLEGESMLSTSVDNTDIFSMETTVNILSNLNMSILSTTENVQHFQEETELNSSVTSEKPIIENNPITTLPPITTEVNTQLEGYVKPTKANISAIIESVSTETPSNIDYLNNVIPEIDKIIYTVEATKYRAKHKPPLHFTCHKIPQIISYKNRCDHKADCEDGTDELDCTCIDYLATFEHQLICDGNYNCADGEDEVDCFGCENDQFLCKRSQMCLSTKYVCDGKSQCPLGEDELDCFALTNGKDIRFDVDGRPKVRFDGFVTKKQNNDWHVICEENMSTHEQEEAAVHICRYLGFSNANSYKVKYINIKESNLHELSDTKRSKRNKSDKEPVMITYNHFDKSRQESRNVVISEPELIKEQCLPNITKTCMTLYVSCDQSLYTNFDEPQLFGRAAVDNFQQWPWIAKLFTNGIYKCTGVLIDVSWVLFRNECLSTINLQDPLYNTVVLGSHKTLFSTKSLYEQVRKVDGVKDLFNSKAVLLHLQEPAEYSTMVKPMIPSTVYLGNNERSLCVAVGEDAFNNTVSLLVKETREDCNSDEICFVRQSTIDTCPNGYPVERPWAGIISCHTKQGWYPAATFLEPRGECNIGNRLIATEIGNLKYQIKYMEETPTMLINQQELEKCDGSRCERGRCVSMNQMCDGVRNCEDGIDEAPESCKRKHMVCSKDPLHRGCQCPVGQLKCRNGQCISKELFKDGRSDCSDGTDEPGQTTCSDYLSRVMPSRLCDGVLHCHDRSDEDPSFCKCFAKNAYRCGRDPSSEDFCVAMDMVCDGIPDCPNGEDERTCIGLNAPQGTQPGIGEVILRSHGVWYSKCYPTESHTKSELEDICREAGFIGGHAKQLPTPEKSYPHNNLVVDQFSDIPLNNNTSIRLRNSHTPIARGTLDANCFPLFIECL